MKRSQSKERYYATKRMTRDYATKKGALAPFFHENFASKR